MKSTPALFLILTLGIAGCGQDSPLVPPARKEVLRRILVPDFVAASVPANKEEDFFRILEAFEFGRQKNEYVRRVEFTSATEATLSFADGGMHGGGNAFVKKKDGRWVIGQKLYFM